MTEECKSIEVERGTVLSIEGSNWVVEKTDLTLAEMSGSLSLRWVGVSGPESETMDEDSPVITIDVSVESKDTLEELKAIRKEAKKATVALYQLKAAQKSIQPDKGKVFCEGGKVSRAAVKELRAGEEIVARVNDHE
ncbi:hypothetical protein RYX56_12510 [Alkalihalophilus lindianensis]|uniref:Uncharacterized protein n=1 Tax=Alkalihalophilus lindianensis TaxID=1630542 RepID=A0ABU3XBB4_9BACI|nr:hypothetical protein [Alkalihalophilus lindianensis]MDV2685178.1 hypothetical protein [Alkalihalophilus lindianensis]